MTRDREILEVMQEIDSDKVIEILMESNEMVDLLQQLIVAHVWVDEAIVKLRALHTYACLIRYQMAEKIVQDRHVGEGISRDKQAADDAGMTDNHFKGI